MKTRKINMFAVIVIAFAAAAASTTSATASQGVEISVIATDGDTGFTTTQCDRAPAGAYVEAVVDMGGSAVTIDMAPVCQSGTATVAFAGIGTNPRVVMKSQGGAVLCSSYVGGLEND